MPIRVKVGSSWKTTVTPYIRVSNRWKACENVWLYQGGGWKVVWTKAPSWGAWSSWYDRQIVAIADQREVKSERQHQCQTFATCYNYKEYAIFRKCWDKRSEDAVKNDPRCSTCGYRNLAIESEHYRGSWANSNGEYNCHAKKTIASGNQWGFGGMKDAYSGWISGAGTTTDTYRVVSSRTAWAYRDNQNNPPGSVTFV